MFRFILSVCAAFMLSGCLFDFNSTPDPSEVQAAPAQKTPIVVTSQKDAVPAKPSSELTKEEKIQTELNVFVKSYIAKANSMTSVNRKKPQVFKRGKYFVARFTEIDASSATTQINKSNSKYFDYIARLSYEEDTFECIGKTKQEALKGPFKVVNAKRMTELPRYSKGKWEN